MKKKVLSFLLALCLLVSVLPATAFAAREEERLTKLTASAAFGKPEASVADPNAVTHTIRLKSGANGFAELLDGTKAAAGSAFYFLADPDDGYMAEIFLDGTETGLVTYLGLNIYGFIMPDNDVSIDIRYVATRGEKHKVELVAGKGGTSSLYSYSATESESVFLSVLPDDQSLFRPNEDVMVSAGTLNYIFMDDETGEHMYELYMPDENVTVYVSHRGSVPLRINPIFNQGKESCTVNIEPKNPRFGDKVEVNIRVGYNFSLERVFASNPVIDQWSDMRYSSCTMKFTMPPYDVNLQVTLERNSYTLATEVETCLGGSFILDGYYLPREYNERPCAPGRTVTITCMPDEGYRLARITGVKNLVDMGNNKYSFIMPEEDVHLRMLFLRKKNPFLDVNETQFFYTPVLWAVGEGITAGISATQFGPNQPCNRAQVVTFLWRYAGCPEPTVRTCPFTDVQKGSWYEKAVLWAVEEGITAGISATAFGPEEICNRAQVVTFLWRFRGQPQPGLTEHPFTDVQKGGWYEKAVLWAVEKGITAGATATTFNPDGKCQRGQVVTFLYRTEAPPPPEPEPFNPVLGEMNIRTSPGTVIYLGETLQLEYVYTSDRSVLTWESYDTSILTIDNNGKVTGVGVGETRVAAYHGDTMVGRLRLVVEEWVEETEPPKPPAERISVSNVTGPYFEGVPGVVGNSMTFAARAIGYDEEGDVVTQPVTVTSSNPEVAPLGLVTINGISRYRIGFKSLGVSTITVTSEDGNVSECFTVIVYDSYETPIGRRLTPEQFVACVNGIMVENGARINTTMGWRLVVLKPDQLTGDNARRSAQSWVREFWPNGIRGMGLAYQGIDEDGNYIFYIHR